MGTDFKLIGTNTKLSLPHRRYSVPETVMRKYSLSRQRSTTSTESETVTMPTPSVQSANIDSSKHYMYPVKKTMNKACQTIPHSSLLSSLSYNTNYRKVKKRLNLRKKANSLDETNSTSKETDDSQFYFDSSYDDTSNFKKEIINDTNLPGEIISETLETKSVSIRKTNDGDEPSIEEEIKEQHDKTKETPDKYVIEEDIKVLLESITKEMTVKLLLGFRAKSLPGSHANTLEKLKTKRNIKSANGKFCNHECTVKETSSNKIIGNTEHGDSTMTNIKDMSQYDDDTTSPQNGVSVSQNVSPPKSGHSSDQSIECYITDCDICAAEGRKCCSINNSSEIITFTSPEIAMTTNELKTSSDFTSTTNTLDQTVTDRSTSTQDSTLSITSITPESFNTSSAENRTKSTNNSNYISQTPIGLVINTEAIIVDPITTKISSQNFNFNHSEPSEHSESSKELPIQSLVITSEYAVTNPIICNDSSKNYVFEMTETDSTITEPIEPIQVIDQSSNRRINEDYENQQILEDEKMYDSLEVGSYTTEQVTLETPNIHNLKKFLDRNIEFRQSTGSAIIENEKLKDIITKRSNSCKEIFDKSGDEGTQTDTNEINNLKNEYLNEEEDDLLEELGFKEDNKSSRATSSFLELCSNNKEFNYNDMCKRQMQGMFYGNKTYEVLTNANNTKNKRNKMGNVMSTSEDSLKSISQCKHIQRQGSITDVSNVSFFKSNSSNVSENDGRLSGYTISRQEITCDTNCDKSNETICGNVMMLRIPLPTDDNGNIIPTCIEGPEIEAYGEELIIPRYSAKPRTVSMLVNTSSADYSSDSELSLADSLEDITSSERTNEHPIWTNKYDKRLVRGDVISLLPENNKKREPTPEAYAYFVTLSGEIEEIKTETIPEPLKKKLMKRDNEIRKHIDNHNQTKRKERKSESLFKKTLKKNMSAIPRRNFYESILKESNIKSRTEFKYPIFDELKDNTIVEQDSKSTQWEEFPDSSVDQENVENNILVEIKDSRWLKCVDILKKDPDLDKIVCDVLLSAASKDNEELELDEKIKNILIDALKSDEENLMVKREFYEEQVVPMIHKSKETSTDDITDSNESNNQKYEVEQPTFKSISVQTMESSLHTKLCDSYEYCELCHENSLKEDKSCESKSNNETNLDEKTEDGIPGSNIDKYDNLISNNLNSDSKDKLSNTSQKEDVADLESQTNNKKITNQIKLDQQKLKLPHDKTRIARPSPRSHSCLNNRLSNRIKIPPRRSAITLGGRFQQKFEAIPEEKNSSVESSEDQQTPPKSNPLRRSSIPSNLLFFEKDPAKNVKNDNEIKERVGSPILNEQARRHSIHGNIPQMNESGEKREMNDQNRRHTIHGNINLNNYQIPELQRLNLNMPIMRGRVIGHRGNFMIGRFCPVGEETQVQKDGNEQILIGEIERLRRDISKGREALEIFKTDEGEEEEEKKEDITTLSKGWINFYLLRDSIDLGSDPSLDGDYVANNNNAEDTSGGLNESRTVNVVGKPDEHVRQYTVQINALEEPKTKHNTKEYDDKLPGLNRTNKRSSRSFLDNSDINLPEIHNTTPVTSPPTSAKSRSPTTCVSESTVQPNASLPLLNLNKKSILKNRDDIGQSSREDFFSQKRPQKDTKYSSASENKRGDTRLPSPTSETYSRSTITPCAELTQTITASSTTCDSRSDSPVLPSIKWPLRPVQRRHINRYNRTDSGRQSIQYPIAQPPPQTAPANSGTCWTVTVAGNSGNPQQPPPDVEMRLSFQSNQNQQNSAPGYVDLPGHRTTHLHKETKERYLKQTIEDPTPTPTSHADWSVTVNKKNDESGRGKCNHEHSSKRPSKKRCQCEREKETPDKRSFPFNWSTVEEILDNRMMKNPSIKSMKWCSSENIQELSVTGLAITPEKKPRVPTMSERDLTRVHHYTRNKLF